MTPVTEIQPKSGYERETSNMKVVEQQHEAGALCAVTHEYALNEERAQLIDGLESQIFDHGQVEVQSNQNNEGSIVQPNDSSVGIFHRLSNNFKASTLSRIVLEWSRNACTAAKLKSSENAVSSYVQVDAIANAELGETNDTSQNGPEEIPENEAVKTKDLQPELKVSETVKNGASFAEPETSTVAVEQEQSHTNPDYAHIISVEGYDGFCQERLGTDDEKTGDLIANESLIEGFINKSKPVDSHQFCEEAGDLDLLEKRFPSEFFSEGLKEEASIFEDANNPGSCYGQLVVSILDGNFEPVEYLFDSEEDEFVGIYPSKASKCMSTNDVIFENNGNFVRKQVKYGTKGTSMACWNAPSDPKPTKYREATPVFLEDILISDDQREFFKNAVIDFNAGHYLLAVLKLYRAVRATARPEAALILLANKELERSKILPQRRRKLTFAENLCTSDHDSPSAYRSGNIPKPVLKRTRGHYTGDAIPIERCSKPLQKAGLETLEEDMKARLMYCMEEVHALGRRCKLADLDEACKRYKNCFKFMRDLADRLRGEISDFSYFLIRVRIDISSAMASMKACGDKVTKLADFINTSKCSLGTIKEVSNQAESILQSLHMSDPLVEYLQEAITQSGIEDEKSMERLKATCELFQRYANYLFETHAHFLKKTLRASVDVEKVKALTGYHEHFSGISQFGLMPQTSELSQRIFNRFQERLDEIQELKGKIHMFTFDVLSRLDNFRREIGVL